MTAPLDPHSEVVDKNRRWMPDWYSYIADLISSTAMWVQSAGSPPNNTFWNPGAWINRIHGRTFFGPAEEHSGNAYPPTGDWLSELFAVAPNGFNGGDGVFQDGLYANTYFLNDITTPNQPGTLGSPSAAIIAGASSKGQGVNSTCYPIGTVAVNDCPTPGHAAGAWGIYVEGHHVGAGAGGTFGAEIDIRNSVSFTYWDPWSTPSPQTIAVALGAGAGLNPAGQFDATAALFIGQNGMKFGTGIMIQNGTIGTHGPGGTISAISMPNDYRIQWFSGIGTVCGDIRGDAGSGVHITPQLVVDGNFLTAGAMRSLPAPSLNPTIDCHNATVAIANGGNSPLAITGGFVVVHDQTGGAAAIYLLMGGSIVAVSLGVGQWVNPTTTPGAGQSSVAWSGSDARIYNNVGGTRTFSAFQVGTG
jgi:hypothetical protein